MRQPTTAREMLLVSKDFAVYYGIGREPELGQYDTVIIEPSGHTRAALHQLRSSGVLVIAYLSVMELAPWAEQLQWLSEDDFLHLADQRARHPQFGNYLLDLRSQRWRRWLLHHAGQLLQAEGYDGLFLDTIGDLEDTCWGAEQRLALIHSAHQFVRDLRATYPEALLIQNNGLESLLPYTAPYLDALCWENPPVCGPASQDWLTYVSRSLAAICARHALRLLVLFDTKPDGGQLPPVCARLAGVDPGLLIYCAPANYLEIVKKHG